MAYWCASANLPAVTINGREPAAEPGCLDATTRDVLIKLIGRAIDLIGVDTARALTPAWSATWPGCRTRGACWQPHSGPAPSPPRPPTIH